MAVAVNLGMQGLAALLLLPILADMIWLLATEWSRAAEGYNAARIMMVMWCLTLEAVAGWRLYSWWYIVVYDDPSPYNELGGATLSVLLFLSAAVSLVAFCLRLRGEGRAHKGE